MTMTVDSKLATAAAPRLKRPTCVVLASINREHGDTGVHTHGRMLASGLREAGVTCDVVSSFSGSK